MERERLRKLYDKVMRPSNDKYARTLRRALALPQADGIIRERIRGKERIDAIDLACGMWAYMPAIAETLLTAFPGSRINLSGLDPLVKSARGVERLAREMGRDLDLERIVEIQEALAGTDSVQRARSEAGLGGFGRFDIVMSFNYLPVASLAGKDEASARILEETAATPISVQTAVFFRCMRELLSHEGLAIVVASVEMPRMSLMMAGAGLRVLHEERNAPEDEDSTLNHRIIIARWG